MRERTHDRYHNRSKIEKVKRPFSRPTRRNPRAPRPTAGHALAVYDGQHLVGSVVERNGEFLAFDVHDHRVGVFANQREALRAIPAARSS